MTAFLILLFFAQAPSKPTNAEIIASIKSGDPAQREATRGKQRAWAAYCAIAGDALANMTAKSPALFDVKPNAKLIAETAKTRDFLHSQLQKMPASKPEMERQRVNYNLGVNQHSASPKDLANFTKQQVFACSDGFEVLWNTLAASR